MYCLMVCSSTVPQKYPRAHKCCPQYRFRNSGNGRALSMFRHVPILVGIGLLEADRLN